MKLDPADIAFSLYIRTRDGWTCQRCGDYHEPPTTRLQCSHFKGRRKEGTRFEPLNADALCDDCHRYFTLNPVEHEAWQIERKGQEVVDMLTLQSNSYKKKDRKTEAIYWRNELKKIMP